METVRFLDLPVAATTPDEAVSAVLASAVGRPQTFRLINAGTLDAAHRDKSYWSLLADEGVNFPDGRPLSKVLNLASPDTRLDQVRGPRLFEACLAAGRASGTKHFLLGSTDETLAQLRGEIEIRFPGTVIAGVYSPPFGQRSADELAKQDQLIVASGADVVWVAMGTPKQDAEALRIRRAIDRTTVAVGAAFDFTAGTKRSVPPILHRLGLEWLFRLATEPRRLWRRYLIGNAVFLGLAARHLMASRKRGR